MAVRPELRVLAGILVALALVVAGRPASSAEERAGIQTAKAGEIESPLSAEESLRHFVLHPALAIEIVASEPQVVDPVAIAFDENGRLWVAEMRDYPNGPAEGQPPKSRIKMLEDRDGDGRYETAHVFADNLLFANGVLPWRGGVIVTLSGEVSWMADTNGDHKADVRETWFTGFSEQNPQLRANHPTFGLDNHIYIANGLRGGTVIAKRKQWAEGAKPVSISGRDFRFDPLTGRYEAISGVGQFGLTFDDWGNRFVCSNRNPSKHIVLEERYLRRNPHLAVSSVFHDVSPAGEQSRVYPISQAWTTSTLHQGQFTAACGVTIYRGDLLPEEFYGNSFTCEPTGYLVHRDVLEPRGATFTSRPGRKGVEFLASRDEWFRPVNLANGPDGALYVVDMYRAVIEHPQFMPQELKQRPDLYYGSDRGRIYRIVPREKTGTGSLAGATPGPRGLASSHLTRAARPTLLGDLPTAELVKLLEHRNAWHRETAARLIYERQDRAARESLERIVLRSGGRRPESRAAALWLLEGLGVLTPEAVLAGMYDSHPRVREQAVRLSEKWIDKNVILRERVMDLSEDDDARLRFQVALSLGMVTDPPDWLAWRLGSIAYREPADVWTRMAVLSSSSGQETELLTAVYNRALLDNAWRQEGVLELVGSIAEVIGSRQQSGEIQRAIWPLAGIPCAPGASADDPPVGRLALVDGLGRGLRRRGKRLTEIAKALSVGDRERLATDFRKAAALARSEKARVGDRLLAISALRHADYQTAGPVLLELATGTGERTLKLTAIDALARYPDAEIGTALLERFTARTPAVRRAIIDVMLSSTARTQLLLDEIEAGRIAAAELDPGRVSRLKRHRDPGIRERAAKLLAAAIPEDRKTVINQYQVAFDLKSDPQRGRIVFEKNCTACHRIGELGVNVAPDIADSRTRTPEQLLVDILDPNRAVDSNYFSYSIVTTGGKVYTGIISAETANSVTLRQQEGKTVTVLRQDIAQMQSTGVSLMPVGMEKNITPQQMADLLSFIKNWRYLDGRVPIELGDR